MISAKRTKVSKKLENFLVSNVKCDVQTFKDCDILVPKLAEYYLDSAVEVQDAIDIAASVFSRQQDKHFVYFQYDPGAGSAGYIDPSPFYEDDLGIENMLGVGDVYINYNSISVKCYGTFVHELVHIDMIATFRNGYYPYRNK